MAEQTIENTEIITDDPNPLKKLLEGFCSPQKIRPIPTFDEDDAVNNKYEPDLTAQAPSRLVVERTPDLNPEPTTPSTTTEDATVQDSAPEIDVSKNVIENRRKRGIENFVMALIFVLATMLSLKKLGYTASDLDFGKSSGSGLKMVDKASVDIPVEEEEPVVSIDEATPEEEEEEEL